MIKTHEHDLDKLKATYSELKQMIERVRSCKYENSNGGDAAVAVYTDGDEASQPIEDFVKLDRLMDQLADRWTAAVNLYTQRRANLKKCLYSYQEYMNTLKNEKESLNAMSNEMAPVVSSNGDGQSTEKFAFVKKSLNEKRSVIETCNKDAATFVRTAKVFSSLSLLFPVFLHFLVLENRIFYLFHVTSLRRKKKAFMCLHFCLLNF